MKTILRTLPGLATALLLGSAVMSRGFGQLPPGVREKEIGYIVAAGVILTIVVVVLTRSRKNTKQQSSGFGYAARTRTGRN